MAGEERDDGAAGGSLGLIIGLCVGVGVLIIGCVGVGILLLVPATQKVRVAAERIKTSNDLKLIGLAYHEHQTRFKKPPAAVEDLKPFMQAEDGRDSPEYQKLQAGDYVVIFGVNLDKTPQPLANTILGYEQATPMQGGAALFGDGSVRSLTVEEFRAAPQAKAGAVDGK